jgi:hypothetical protein
MTLGLPDNRTSGPAQGEDNSQGDRTGQPTATHGECANPLAGTMPLDKQDVGLSHRQPFHKRCLAFRAVFGHGTPTLISGRWLGPCSPATLMSPTTVVSLSG